MPSPPSPRATVPLGERSAVPSVRGIHAWAAVLVAAGACALGIVADAVRGSELTSVFAVMYVLGCVVAVVAVRHHGLFTAMVQPPLILFVGVPVAYQLITEDASTSLKDIVLNVAIPLVNRFPLMVVATVLTLIIGGARLYLDQRQGEVRAHTPGKPQRSSRTNSGAIDTGAAPTWARGPARSPDRPAARTQHPDPRTQHPVGEPPIPHYPRQEPTRRRPDSPQIQPYPPPRVRYRDRD